MNSNADGITDSAWFLTSYEETKALGEYLDEEEEVIEIGKNIWYHTFEFNKPEVVQQGGMLNQPSAYDPEHPDLTVGASSGFLEIPEDEFGYTVYMTEIARRASIMSQGIKALDPEKDGTYAGTTAYLLYKEGTLNQGGPADIMARRIVLPADFDPLVDNPYAFTNLACETWVDTTDNPNYLQGLCADPATNLSGTTNDLCYTAASVIGADPSLECVDDFPWDGSIEDSFPKVSEWDQTVDTLDDQSWENPFDVSKGHRGFIDGNFVMIMYAWSPNWKANSVGNDKYNLYVRRSFDGGLTWTTTPADLGGTGISNSTVDPSLCENWGIGGDEIVPVCYTYGPGEFERARNVSQLTGTKVTILDPRYTPSGGLKKWIVEPYKDLYLDTSANTIEAYDTLRDPSKFFMIYETGDNTTAAEGEPTPLDLYYSRATVYGDIWDWEEVEVADGTELRWFGVETKKDDLSGEAAMLANPSGDFMYTNWNQWKEEILEDGTELISDSDIMFSRYFYNTFKDLIPATTIVYSGPTAYSTSLDETITLIANLRDYDQMDGGEEVEYEWLIDGVEMAVDFNSNGSLDDDCYRTKQCNIPARNLSNGWHGFSVRGKDNDGNWSKSVTKDQVLVAEYIYTTHLPLTLR